MDKKHTKYTKDGKLLIATDKNGEYVNILKHTIIKAFKTKTGRDKI